MTPHNLQAFCYYLACMRVCLRASIPNKIHPDFLRERFGARHAAALRCLGPRGDGSSAVAGQGGGAGSGGGKGGAAYRSPHVVLPATASAEEAILYVQKVEDNFFTQGIVSVSGLQCGGLID